MAIFHRKLFSLYAEQILRCQDQEKYRFGFRRFILYSDHLNKQETLAELKKNEEEFAFEIILLQTDVSNQIGWLYNFIYCDLGRQCWKDIRTFYHRRIKIF